MRRSESFWQNWLPNRWGGMVLVVLLICEAFLIPAPQPAHAANFSVGCGDVAGLIAAISTANANGQADTIDLAAGCTYTLTAIDNSATNGPNGLPVITSAITINGNGATIERSIAPGTLQFRLIEIAAGGSVTANALQLRNGAASGGGGGIFSHGFLTIANSTFNGNTAGFGGAIANYSRSTVTVTASTFTGNATIGGGAGGAIFADDGNIAITNSTFSANASDGYGGALMTGVTPGTSPFIEITNSTLSQNTARSGGTIYIQFGGVELQNSIVASSSSGANCLGSVISLGGNLSSDGFCGGGPGDLLNTAPLLAPLADNGGPTPTHALLPGSPAIDAANNATCTTVDQRGVARPQGASCDIGAFEQTTTFVVTTTADGGPGSLRQAILDANAAPNGAVPDAIYFNIAGVGPQTIAPLTALPNISGPVVIDGYTQPGYGGTPLIHLNGAGAGPSTNGLVITAGNSTVRGLAINGFSGDGLRLIVGGGNVVQSNYIGTNAAGTTALGNANGVLVDNASANNRIGGAAAGARNVISGNRGAAIWIRNAGANGNLVQGNYVGTNAAGNAPLNNQNGIVVSNGAQNNTIGGTVAGAGNVVAASNDKGIVVQDIGTTGNVVQGNLVGVSADGTAALGNSTFGVAIYGGATGNTIGGTAAGARNIISGNLNIGLVISDAGTSNNLVQGNYIGADIGGSAGLGNAVGVQLQNGSSNSTIVDNTISSNRASGVVVFSTSAITIAHNTIANNTGSGVSLGGTGTFVTGNTIDSNAADGITITSSGNKVSEATTWGGNVIARNGGRGVNVVSGDRNTIIRNAIYDNVGPGIDLGNDGPTPNDAGDGDTGPNNVQNTPALGSASIGNDDNVTISYTVDSATTNAAYPLQIEFFAVGAVGAQGRTLLGSDILAAPGTRTFSLGNAAALGIAGGDRLVATATDANGNTSEFSPPVATTQVSKPASIVLSEPLLPLSSRSFGSPPFAVAGRPFDIQATIVDSTGTTVSNFNGPVTLALRAGSGTAGATLGGTLTVAALNGTATFQNLSIDLPGSGYQVLASAGGALNSTGQPFDVVEPETEAPPTDSINGATQLGALPAERAGWIATADDADWYRFNTALTGVTVTVDLTNLPADYDLALLSDPRPSAATAISDGVSLTNVADASQIDASGKLISLSLAESLNRIAAISHLPGAAQYVLNLSAKHDLENEAIVAKLPRSGTYYLLVFSTAGVSDNLQPYRLRVSLQGGTLLPTPPPAVPVASLNLEPNHDVQTIFLYNSARMRARYTTQETNTVALNDLVARLEGGGSLMTASAGASIDLSGSQLPDADLAKLNQLYAAWDAHRAQPDFANAVAQQIWFVLRSAIETDYPNTTNLVLVGGDDIIPFYRVSDETTVAPEGQYYRELSATGALSSTAPLSSSLRGNFIQTDDFYADRVPTSWRGRLLFVPDLGVGRLVETPSDILSYLDAVDATGYTIDAAPDSAKVLVTGYDFVKDEATTFADMLSQLGFQPAGQPALDKLINDTWNVEQLVGVWIGGQAQHQLAVFDGHFTHNQLIAADGSLLQADQLPPSGNYFQNALLFALGCHSGLSASDGSFTTNSLDTDFAQAVLQQGGTWLGNTGYTYADPYTIGYSQRLGQLFVAQIGRPVSGTLPLTTTVGYVGAPLGESVARAKQAYLRELGPNGLSVSDEKALTQLTLYGLPFLRIKVHTPRDVPVPAPIDVTGKPPKFTRTITVTNTFTMEQTPNGDKIPRVVAQVYDTFTNKTTYITSTDQMSPGRPVLPSLSYDITVKTACQPACAPPEPRGVQLLDATTLPELSNFAPHVTTPVTDPVTQQGSNTILQEPGMTAQNIWVPDIPYTYQRISVISGTEPISSDRLLISPTQFNAADATHGRLRQFETMVFEISYLEPSPQVLGCGWLQRVCNWFSGKSRVSKKKKTTLASQALQPAQIAETLVLSTVLTLSKDLSPADFDVSATYTVDGIHWQKDSLAFESSHVSGDTQLVTFTKDITAPTWPLPEFAAFFEFKDKDGNVLVGTPRGAEFHRLFVPLVNDRVSYKVSPDLIGSISITPDKRAFAAGEPSQITATITNTGNADAGPFWVDLFINPSAPPTMANVTWNSVCAMDPCFGLTWKVPGLPVGQSITLSSTDLAPGYSVWPGWFAAGTTDLYLYVDSWNPGVASGAVEELDENNNAAHLGGLRVTGVNPPFLRTRSAAELPMRPAP